MKALPILLSFLFITLATILSFDGSSDIAPICAIILYGIAGVVATVKIK